jgi:hypothetical protein
LKTKGGKELVGNSLIPGLPDGIFSNQKSQFGKILDGLGIEDVGIFYGHLVYFWPFGIFCVHLVLCLNTERLNAKRPNAKRRNAKFGIYD